MIQKLAVANGKTHDFKIFKSTGLHISENINILADLGFLGIYKIHKNSLIPHKSSKNKPLNKELASKRTPMKIQLESLLKDK